MRIRWSAVLISVLVSVAACDSGITGDMAENQPPDTHLSVRDVSLVDNLEGADRLTSTVKVSWTGDDPDGFVQRYDIRFFNVLDANTTDPAWTSTVSTDTLILLPIRRGDRDADVEFEVRAVDNLGVPDPTPARTVFPIKNGPPELRFSLFDTPPDTTFPVASFVWTATDPEGPDNISRIDISLNDSTSFIALPPDAQFITLVGELDLSGSAPSLIDARVFLGRGFESTNLRVPNWRMNDDNTVYVRAVDATDTTSTIERISWYTKAQTSDVLFVNDYRRSVNPVVQSFHMGILREYLPAEKTVDVWTITTPFATGSAGNTPRSDQLPPSADPTLRQMLARFRYIYWVATNSTDRIQGNNLPFAAAAMDLFFNSGGKILVHTPISLPPDPENNLGNAAVLLLPLSDMISFPDSLRQSLRMQSGAAIAPLSSLPGVSQALPTLEPRGIIVNSLPFRTDGTNIISLYGAEYRYITRRGGRQGPWFGSNVVASISTDQRVGLFALPMLNDQSGEQLLIGADGDPDAPRQAIKLILESLGFPR